MGRSPKPKLSRTVILGAPVGLDLSLLSRMKMLKRRYPRCMVRALMAGPLRLMRRRRRVLAKAVVVANAIVRRFCSYKAYSRTLLLSSVGRRSYKLEGLARWPFLRNHDLGFGLVLSQAPPFPPTVMQDKPTGE